MEGCLPALKAEGHEMQKEHHQLLTHQPGSDLHVFLLLIHFSFCTIPPLTKTFQGKQRYTYLNIHGQQLLSTPDHIPVSLNEGFQENMEDVK